MASIWGFTLMSASGFFLQGLYRFIHGIRPLFKVQTLDWEAPAEYYLMWMVVFAIAAYIWITLRQIPRRGTKRGRSIIIAKPLFCLQAILVCPQGSWRLGGGMSHTCWLHRISILYPPIGVADMGLSPHSGWWIFSHLATWQQGDLCACCR
jgi:hypothetical protein